MIYFSCWNALLGCCKAFANGRVESGTSHSSVGMLLDLKNGNFSASPTSVRTLYVLHIVACQSSRLELHSTHLEFQLRVGTFHVTREQMNRIWAPQRDLQLFLEWVVPPRFFGRTDTELASEGVHRWRYNDLAIQRGLLHELHTPLQALAHPYFNAFRSVLTPGTTQSRTTLSMSAPLQSYGHPLNVTQLSTATAAAERVNGTASAIAAHGTEIRVGTPIGPQHTSIVHVAKPHGTSLVAAARPGGVIVNSGDKGATRILPSQLPPLPISTAGRGQFATAIARKGAAAHHTLLSHEMIVAPCSHTNATDDSNGDTGHALISGRRR